MRYIITQTQAHNLIYKFLDKMFIEEDFRKEINPYVKDGNTWNIEFFDDKGRNTITLHYYGPGEYDDGTHHNGIATLIIHPNIVDALVDNLSMRESKILDVIGDWVSNKLNLDIDEIEIYPRRTKPRSY